MSTEPRVVKPVSGSPLLCRVTGDFILSSTGIPLVKPAGSATVYIMEGLEGNLDGFVGKKIAVLGKIKTPDPQKIDGSDVRFIITVSSCTVAGS